MRKSCVRTRSRPPSTRRSQAEVAELRDDTRAKHGYWLLLIAGLGIFCGCVGKSAQFPLHVWLPDAMEGPTPVSALVHSATMVAAGVYLVGRVLSGVHARSAAGDRHHRLHHACSSRPRSPSPRADIKRVLAYSTVSQLGYMMLALGVGGWLAGLFHLITHAFFKSLLFLCSGSVIHAVPHERHAADGRPAEEDAHHRLHDARRLPGDRRRRHSVRRSASAAIYSKDAIVAQALQSLAPQLAADGCSCLFVVPACGAAITAFYMFRLWYMTFAGEAARPSSSTTTPTNRRG